MAALIIIQPPQRQLISTASHGSIGYYSINQNEQLHPRVFHSLKWNSILFYSKFETNYDEERFFFKNDGFSFESKTILLQQLLKGVDIAKFDPKADMFFHVIYS